MTSLTGNGLSGGGGSSLPSQGGNSGKYLTTNGTAASWGAVSSGMVYITSGSFSGGTSVTLSLPTGYTMFKLYLIGLTQASGDNLAAQVSTDGISFDGGAGTYDSNIAAATTAAHLTTITSAGSSKTYVDVSIFNPRSSSTKTTFITCSGSVSTTAASQASSVVVSARLADQADVAIKLLAHNGTAVTGGALNGDYILYGLASS